MKAIRLLSAMTIFLIVYAVLTALAFASTSVGSLAILPAPKVVCAEEYIVQPGDWLSTIAKKYFGDPLMYPILLTATNQKHASDNTFASIADPDLIEVGWKLCVPLVSSTIESDQAKATLGYSAGMAGDVNGDGYADVIVGSPSFDHGLNAAQVFVYYGSAAGLSPTPDWTAANDQADTDFGRWVGGAAGDVNGDGYADVIVSAPMYDKKGRIFVYYSTAGLLL